MWILSDYKTVETDVGISYLSSKSQDVYDCGEERSRLLALTMFSGNMGSGKVVYSSSNEGKWDPVAPKSVGQILWEVVCKKQ